MAWYISSQETTEVIQLLFKAIKERSPDVGNLYFDDR